MPASYFDIDTILAEEELIPCVTVFDMNHLSFLDPDGVHDRRRQARRSGSSSSSSDLKGHSVLAAAAAHEAAATAAEATVLPEKSKIKLPLWTINQWVQLNFIRPQLPRHYARRARERYDADPADVDLRRKNERFFVAGRMLVDVLERGAGKGLKELNKQSSSSSKMVHRQALEVLASDVQDLRRTLIKLYSGERLRRIFDWSSSGTGATDGGNVDDVSSYLEKLTAMERTLFYTGQNAATSVDDWKMFGNRRLLMGPVRPPKPVTTSLSSSSIPATNSTTTQQQQKRRAVTPGGAVDNERGGGQRRRLY